jgi:nuclear pore complex protein Nup133
MDPQHCLKSCNFVYQDLLDDFPASDPRWVESLPQAAGGGGQGGPVLSSTSLLVLHQLEDKLQCHELLVAFLKVCGLWGRLAAITVRGRPTPTVLCLAEAAEKNVAAITLRTLHSEHAAVMDAATRIVLSEREVTATGNLTVQVGSSRQPVALYNFAQFEFS